MLFLLVYCCNNLLLWKKMIVPSFIVIILIALSLWPEGNIALILAALLVVFYVIQLKAVNPLLLSVRKKQPNSWRFLFILIMLFIIFSFARSLFALDIALALEKSIFLSISLLSFLFFLILPDKLLKIWNIWQIIKVFLLFSSAIMLLSYFFPFLNEFISDSLLFYKGAGHSHFAIFYVLFLPLIWFDFFQKKNWLNSLSLASAYLIVFLCFGRVIEILVFVETLLIFFLQRRNILFNKKIFQYFITIILAILLASLFLLSIGTIKPNWIKCYLPNNSLNYFCKQWSGEKRLQYWQQAWLGFQQQPIIGWGLNSYGTYVSNTSSFGETGAQYVHNDYFQAFFDGGIVGGVLFCGIMLVLLHCLFQSWKKNGSIFRKREDYLLIGIVAIFINALFDFDWQIMPVFLLINVCCALCLRSAYPNLLNENSTMFDLKWLSVSYLSISIIIFFNGVLVLLSTLLLMFHQYDWSFQLYPFMAHTENCQQYRLLNQTHQNVFLLIHAKDSYFLDTCVSFIQDNSKKREIYAQLFSINKKYQISNSYLIFLSSQLESCIGQSSRECVYSSHEIVYALQQIIAYVSLHDLQIFPNTSSIPFSVREDIAQIALKLESQFLAIHEAAAAQEAYRLYQQIKPQ